MRGFLIGWGWLWLSLPALAASPADFHRAVYALHEQQVARHTVRTEEEQGEYEGSAAARYRYVDTRYYDNVNGRLLSRVRRDAAEPASVHIVEVNLYEQGRLVRDFGSVSLPWAPTLPVRTMINLHHYHDGLHSFRQYDSFGELAYEACEGVWQGKPVRLALDASDIDAARISEPAYQPCFAGIDHNWAQYLTPH